MSKNREKMEHLLEKYPVTIDISVKWGEMDCFHHVNNTIYFKYFENVRIPYFEKIGMMTFLKEQRIGPILASQECRYKTPLVFPDIITVGTRVTRMGEHRFIMEYIIVSHEQKRVAAVGSGDNVTYDYKENRKAAIPDQLRENIITLEGGKVDPWE